MTVRMPLNAVNSEVYIKTPRGNSGILIDPWTSSNLEKEMEQLPHPPTKSQRTSSVGSTRKGPTGARLMVDRSSLEIAAGPSPNRKQNPHTFGLNVDHPSARQHQLNKVRYRNTSRMEKSCRKRTREMSPTRSFADPVVVDSSDEETETADEDHKDDLPPQSPPDHEKGHQPLKYVPRFPVYPPLDDSSENAEFSSIPYLEIPREQMSHVQGKPKEPDHGTHMMAPVGACTDVDHFEDTDRQDTLRQQLDKEINGAPWHKDGSQQALEEMEKVVKTVKPAYEGFWCQNDSNILNRLNEAAKKLKDRHAGTNSRTGMLEQSRTPLKEPISKKTR